MVLGVMEGFIQDTIVSIVVELSCTIRLFIMKFEIPQIILDHQAIYIISLGHLLKHHVCGTARLTFNFASLRCVKTTYIRILLFRFVFFFREPFSNCFQHPKNSISRLVSNSSHHDRPSFETTPLLIESEDNLAVPRVAEAEAEIPSQPTPEALHLGKIRQAIRFLFIIDITILILLIASRILINIAPFQRPIYYIADSIDGLAAFVSHSSSTTSIKS